MSSPSSPPRPPAPFYAVIPAGGAGTRLWPLSRADEPKFLHDLTGSGRSLIQATVDRVTPLTVPDGVVVVTGTAHAPKIAAQLPDLPVENILTETSPRDSMAAIGLAAAVLQERHGDVVLGSFAADQVIAGRDAFERAVREGIAAAEEGYVVTIGIAASRPSTDLSTKTFLNSPNASWSTVTVYDTRTVWPAASGPVQVRRRVAAL